MSMQKLNPPRLKTIPEALQPDRRALYSFVRGCQENDSTKVADSLQQLQHLDLNSTIGRYNGQYQNLLSLSLSCGCYAAAQQLIEMDAVDPLATTIENRDALCLMLLDYNREAITWLLAQLGRRLLLNNNHPSLHFLIEQGTRQDAETLHYWLDISQMPVDVLGDKNLTPLAYAFECYQTLVEKFGEQPMRGRHATNPLLSMIALLCDKGARLDAGPKGRRPSDILARMRSSDYKDKLESLLELKQQNTGATIGKGQTTPNSEPMIEVFSIKNTASSNKEVKAISQMVKDAKKNVKPYQRVNTLMFEALAQLADEFPNFSEVIEYVMGELSLANQSSSNWVKISPVLLVGDPGIGKTAFIVALNAVLQIPLLKLNAGVMSANFTLAGMDSSWSNSKPGVIANQLIYGSHANGLVFIDELDKAIDGTGNGGNPLSALYDLLEEGSAHFVDQYYGQEVHFNANLFSFFGAANDLLPIAEPIINRFEVFEIAKPSVAQLQDITQRMYQTMCAGLQLKGTLAPVLSSEVVDSLISLPPRTIKKTLRRALGSVHMRQATHMGLEDLPSRSTQAVKPLQRIGF